MDIALLKYADVSVCLAIDLSSETLLNIVMNLW